MVGHDDQLQYDWNEGVKGSVQEWGAGEGVGEVCEIMRKICSVFGAGI